MMNNISKQLYTINVLIFYTIFPLLVNSTVPIVGPSNESVSDNQKVIEYSLYILIPLLLLLAVVLLVIFCGKRRAR
jgi:hypothetical protein